MLHFPSPLRFPAPQLRRQRRPPPPQGRRRHRIPHPVAFLHPPVLLPLLDLTANGFVIPDPGQVGGAEGVVARVAGAHAWIEAIADGPDTVGPAAPIDAGDHIDFPLFLVQLEVQISVHGVRQGVEDLEQIQAAGDLAQHLSGGDRQQPGQRHGAPFAAHQGLAACLDAGEPDLPPPGLGHDDRLQPQGAPQIDQRDTETTCECRNVLSRIGGRRRFSGGRRGEPQAAGAALRGNPERDLRSPGQITRPVPVAEQCAVHARAGQRGRAGVITVIEHGRHQLWRRN